MGLCPVGLLWSLRLEKPDTPQGQRAGLPGRLAASQEQGEVEGGGKGPDTVSSPPHPPVLPCTAFCASGRSVRAQTSKLGQLPFGGLKQVPSTLSASVSSSVTCA